MKCQYCEKDYAKLSALRSHERFCSQNPNRVENPHTGKPGGNQFTKAREAGEPIPESGNKAAALRKYLATPFENLGWDSKKRRVLEEQGYKCNRCGLAEWQGIKLSLEVDHKDGNTANNQRENLEGLCPNCHSITPTWRGRNKGKRGVTDEQLVDVVSKAKNIRQGLLALGLAAKGGNYKRAKRLLT